MNKLSDRALASAIGVIAAVLLVIAVSGTAGASPTPFPLSAEDKATLSRVETYLNGVKTLTARFVQVSSNGEAAEGSLTLARPGRMRLDYEPPVPVLIVADGTWLIYNDRELNQVSYIPLSSTPAAILVDEQISLPGDNITVTGLDRSGDELRVTVVRTENPEEGSLTLVFSEQPLALRKWIVVDAQGVVTTLSLMSPRLDGPVDPELFRFRNPKFFNDDP